MTPPAALGSATRQLTTFFVGTHYCGIAVERVQELLRYQQMTPVPLAPPLVRGLINLRGQIVTAIDMRRRLGLPEASPGSRPMNVILRTDDGPLSLLVDRIGEVLEVDAQAFEPPPESLSGIGRELVAGVIKLPDRLLLVLDPARVPCEAAPSAGAAGDGGSDPHAAPGRSTADSIEHDHAFPKSPHQR